MSKIIFNLILKGFNPLTVIFLYISDLCNTNFNQEVFKKQQIWIQYQIWKNQYDLQNSAKKFDLLQLYCLGFISFCITFMQTIQIAIDCLTIIF